MKNQKNRVSKVKFMHALYNQQKFGAKCGENFCSSTKGLNGLSIFIDVEF